VAVQGDRGRGLEQLAIKGGEDADDVVGPGAGLDNAGAGGAMLVNQPDCGGVNRKLTFDQWPP
jgi:hypothetical protein